jgi:hypothetical protein
MQTQNPSTGKSQGHRCRHPQASAGSFEAPPWSSSSSRQANQAGKLPVDADELGIPKPDHRRSRVLDHLRPLRAAHRVPSEITKLPSFSLLRFVSWIIIAPIAAVHRRAAMSPELLRWPIGHSTTTKWFIVVPWFQSIQEFVPGNLRSLPPSSFASPAVSPVHGQQCWPGQCHRGSWRGPGPSISDSG